MLPTYRYDGGCDIDQEYYNVQLILVFVKCVSHHVCRQNGYHVVCFFMFTESPMFPVESQNNTGKDEQVISNGVSTKREYGH